MTSSGLEGVYSVTDSHLGGNVREGDPFTFSPRVWNYVLERYAVRSVLDLGSGLGYSAQFFYGRGRQVIAVDGLDENVRQATYPTIKQDLTKGPVSCVVDLVHCQEVVEHIDAEYVDNLVQSMACGRFILITHAVPGQGGYHHVNEQPSEYWIKHMERFKCVLLMEDTSRIRVLAARDGARYLAQTGMIFANKAR